MDTDRLKQSRRASRYAALAELHRAGLIVAAPTLTG